MACLRTGVLTVPADQTTLMILEQHDYEEDLSTQPAGAQAHARVQDPHGKSGWPSGSGSAPCERTQEAHGLIRWTRADFFPDGQGTQGQAE